MPNKTAIVIFSGGPDSTAALLWATRNKYDVLLITYQLRYHGQYGELTSAINIARILGVEISVVSLNSLIYSGLSPEIGILMHSKGRDEEAKSKGRDTLPFGSGMILSITASIAMYRGVDTIIWGATANDGASNPQYSQAFSDELSGLISRYSNMNIKIIAPLAGMRKYEIIKEYFEAEPSLFGNTWSCVENEEKQCGSCHPCIARRSSAQVAKIPDSTPYKYDNFVSLFSEEEIEDPTIIQSPDDRTNCSDRA